MIRHITANQFGCIVGIHINAKCIQSSIIKDIGELQEVTDVLLRLIHVELSHALVSGPLYLSPGNELVAWIQHAVSYFHWIKRDLG